VDALIAKRDCDEILNLHSPVPGYPQR